MRAVHRGCLIGNVCTVATERPGAVRPVLYREAMVVLGAMTDSEQGRRSVLACH